MDRLPELGAMLMRDLRQSREHQDERRADVLAARSAPARRKSVTASSGPRLRVISCWNEGHAADPARELARQFPQAEVQGKGVIATEGFVSLPFVGQEGSCRRALALLRVPSRRRARELQRWRCAPRGGARARAALRGGAVHGRRTVLAISSTTSSRSPAAQARVPDRSVRRPAGPRLRLVRRKAQRGARRAGAARSAFAAADMSPSFAMVACDPTLTVPAYVRIVETAESGETLDCLARRVEAALCRSFHYGHSRRLGQLGPLRVFPHARRLWKAIWPR